MKNTFICTKFFIKDLIYKKIFIVSLLFGVLFVIISLLLGPLSYSEESRLAANFSLAGSQIALILLSVLMGANFIREDLEIKSVFSYLTSPISRSQYVLSKFLAFSFGLFFMTLSLWCFFFLISYMIGIEVDSMMLTLLPFIGIYFESVLLFSFSLLISLHTSFLLTVTFSFSVFMAGHWLDTVHFLMQKSEGVFITALSWFFLYAFPNLESLNWKAQLTYNEWEPALFYIKSLSYALIWIALFVLTTVLTFSKKDL